MFKIEEDIIALTNNKLTERFKGKIISFEMSYDIPVFVIEKEILIELLQFLRDDESLQYKFLTTLCGVHYPDAKEQLGLIYHLHSFKNNVRIRIKTFTNIYKPIFPTATNLWPTANWMEREAYDFYGIIFEGHPNLKRILNVEDMTYFPLRKEIPLEDQTREDKNDKMFGR